MSFMPNMTVTSCGLCLSTSRSIRAQRSRGVAADARVDDLDLSLGICLFRAISSISG